MDQRGLEDVTWLLNFVVQEMESDLAASGSAEKMFEPFKGLLSHVIQTARIQAGPEGDGLPQCAKLVLERVEGQFREVLL